jgi:hypothetical protein
MVEEEFFAAAPKLRRQDPAHAIAKAFKARLLPLRPRVSTLKKLGIAARRCAAISMSRAGAADRA